MDLPSTSRNKNSFSLYRNNKTDIQEESTNAYDIRWRKGDILTHSDPIHNKNKNIFRSKMKNKSCSTTIPSDLCRNHVMEKNTFPDELNLSASEAKLIACKQLMKSLTRSIHNTKKHNFDFASPAGFQNEENLLKPSINLNQHVINASRRAEKTTYCRPVVNIYSYEFIQKTMERNTKLESLVNKLLQVREKEKQNEAWNNYINELKNKHGYNDSLPKTSPILLAAENENSNIIDDCYNKRYEKKLSDHLLNDIYDGTRQVSPEVDSHVLCGEYRQTPSKNRHLKYTNNSVCFPTSPEGKLAMLNQERQRQDYWRCHPIGRGYDYNKIVVKKERKPLHRKFSLKSFMVSDQKRDIKNTSIQTDMKIIKYCKKCFGEKHIIDDNVNDSSSEENVKHIKCKCNLALSPLSNIENKLDTLIRSVRAFIGDTQSKKKKCCEGVLCYDKCNLNKCRSDTFSSRLKNKIICGVAQNDQQSTSSFSGSLTKRHETIDDILYEEMNKSDKVKRDIEEILCNNDGQCAVQVTIDIPTRDHSTEVTDSLHQEIVKDLNGADSKRMAIAVNTDPLGLLALFRVSTDTVKQILSYVPNLTNCSYLTRLPIGNKQIVNSEGTRYVCNICGASFSQASELSDHVQKHNNLSNQRSCCVCRHLVEAKQHRSVLFPCRHCGQLFTRAYCRELHEQTCRHADKRLGDVPSLMLLS